jgi:hypothetical protein
VRADRPEVFVSDHVIVQNGIGAHEGDHFVPLWPQPGLVPRLRSRGERVMRMAYAGRTGASPDWFFADAFHHALRKRGVVFDIRERKWNDYRDVDLAIAARVAAAGMLAVKPATKLYNAWLAGVPMLAAPEPAYRELRRSPLDFIEVHSADDVLRAIDRLRADGRLYRAMVDNGRERARDFGVDAIRTRWLTLIDRTIVPAFIENREALASRRLWYMGAMVRQKLRAKLFRANNALELVRLASSARARSGMLSGVSTRAPSASRLRPRSA